MKMKQEPVRPEEGRLIVNFPKVSFRGLFPCSYLRMKKCGENIGASGETNITMNVLDIMGHVTDVFIKMMKYV